MRGHRSRIAAAVTIAVALLVPAVRSIAGEPPRPAGPPTRLVVLKFDALPPAIVDRYVRQTDPRTGRSILPWIDRLFYQGGVRFDSFYSHGMSLSVPAWSILDTGHHAVIKGNFEYDRHTGEGSDYLNFIHFYAEAAQGTRVYPRSVEVLDAAGVPLLSDAFAFERRKTGIQLIRRGVRFPEFLKVTLQPVKGPVAERFGDLLVGVDFHKAFDLTTQESLLEAIKDPDVRYVDYYNANVDHVLHDDNSSEGIVRVLRETDRIIGQAYAAIVESGTADRTILVVVSDHGMTFEENGAYSQGINLASYLGRRDFGAHHLITKDGPLATYSLRMSVFKPWFSPPPVTVSRESYYLADRTDQATCALDFDGNERAQIHFRHPDLNRLQMLFRALKAGDLSPAAREVASRAALSILDRHRDAWRAEAASIREEVAAVEARDARDRPEVERLERETDVYRARSKRHEPIVTPPIPEFGGVSRVNATTRPTDADARLQELKASIHQGEQLCAQYRAYCDSLELRARIRTAAELLSAKEETLLGPRDLGENLSLADLRSYPVGLRRVALDSTGGLDEATSFVTIDYLDAFSSLRVKNSLRAGGGAAPVEFSSVRLPAAEAARAAVESGLLPEGEAAGVSTAILLYGSEQRQLLLLERGAADGPELALLPVRSIRMDRGSGRIAVERATWQPGLPLELFDDPSLETGGVEPGSWLSRFHPTLEWLAAAHLTREGLGVVGLSEVYSDDYRDDFAAAGRRDSGEGERLVRRFELRRREAVTTDLFLHAARGWNFDTTDFNPGGNHGGFGRQSMRSTLWVRGGGATPIAEGPEVVEAPYDALDFAPTIFEAAGLTSGGRLPDDMLRWGFRPFPGRIASELFKLPAATPADTPPRQ